MYSLDWGRGQSRHASNHSNAATEDVRYMSYVIEYKHVAMLVCMNITKFILVVTT